MGQGGSGDPDSQASSRNPVNKGDCPVPVGEPRRERLHCRHPGFITLAFWASITILHVETVPEANIRSAEDALWWAATTMTTVGYGDKYPVTTEGRVLGFILMVCGVGLFGTFTGYVASWFLQGRKKNAQILSIQEEVHQLREEIEGLSRMVEHNQESHSAEEPQRPRSDSPSGAAGEP